MKIIPSIIVLIGFIIIPYSPGKAASRWVESTSISGENITGIASYELDQAWAVSGNLSGGIYAYDGSTWTLQTETGTPLQAIDSYQDEHIYAAGNLAGNGRIFYNDEEDGWVLQTEIAGNQINDIFTTPWGYTWAPAGDGIIYRNYGRSSWTIHTDTGDETWYAVDGIDQDNCWAVGYGGGGVNKIMEWHSTPYTWSVLTEVNLGGTNRLLDMTVVSPPNLWFGGDNGLIVHYDDPAWSISTLGAETVRAVAAFPQGEEGILATAGGGYIYRYNGAIWEFQTDILTAVLALDRSTEFGAWAGAGGDIFKEIPVRRVYDYDGDGHSDIAVFRPSAGLWAVRGITRLYFGASGDTPAPGDYNGDSVTDVAVFRPSTGLWVARGITRAYFGTAGDEPIPRDYDGDGIADIALFRPSTGLWALRGMTRFYFGGSADTPLPDDYGAGDESGDGIADILIFRESTGLWALRGVSRAYFGRSGDLPACGYFHDPIGCSVGIFRPSTGLWAIWGETRVYYGTGSDTPVPANYDREEFTDMIGIFRSSTGLWSWPEEHGRVYFGGTGDIPVTR